MMFVFVVKCIAITQEITRVFLLLFCSFLAVLVGGGGCGCDVYMCVCVRVCVRAEMALGDLFCTVVCTFVST